MNNYLLLCDVLGFSSITYNLDSDSLKRRIAEWIDVVQTTKADTGVQDTQLISDTLFVLEQDSTDGLRRLLRFAQTLIERSIARSLPIRGTITYGDVEWGALTYGKPVIDAHQLERSLDWIGVACSPMLPRIDEFWDWNLVVPYPPPKTTGPIQLHPVLAWNVPNVDKLISLTTGDGLYKEKEIIRWEWEVKVMRTRLFAQYLDQARAASLSPDTYWGKPGVLLAHLK